MSYLRQYAQQVREFLLVCRRLGELLYVTSHGGNLAWRLADELILITPTRMRKAELSSEDLVFIDLAGATVEGRRQPTGEKPMYLNFFRERPDVRSVIHCHPPYTNAFAIMKKSNWLMRPVFPETVVEVGPVPLIPYGEPITQELADNFLPFVKKYNAFLMENHGLVIMSPGSIRRTMDLVEILEVSSISLLQTLAVGPLKELSRSQVRGLENTQRTRQLPPIGAPEVNASLVDLFFPAKAKASAAHRRR
jgi:L-fuculose-phosphate aldolase